MRGDGRPRFHEEDVKGSQATAQLRTCPRIQGEEARHWGTLRCSPHPCPAVGPARDLGGPTPSGPVFHCAAAPQGCLGGLPWHSDDGHSYLRRPGRPPVADAGGGDKAWQFHALKVVLCKSAPLSHPPPPSLCTLITQAPQRRSWFDLNSRRGWELGVGMCVFIFPLHPLGPVAEGEGWGAGERRREKLHLYVNSCQHRG